MKGHEGLSKLKETTYAGDLGCHLTQSRDTKMAALSFINVSCKT